MAWEHRNKFQADKPLDEMKPGEKAAGAPLTRRGRRVFNGHRVFTCPGCGARSYGDMAYCTECGYKLSRKCPSCGAQWRYEYSYAFCPGCGTQFQPRKEPEGREPGRKKASVPGQTGGGS